jgi:hypothetical protein
MSVTMEDVEAAQVTLLSLYRQQADTIRMSQTCQSPLSAFLLHYLARSVGAESV